MRFVGVLALVLVDLGIAEAVQEHGGSEGLIAHELAHLFLLVSSLALFYSIYKIHPPKNGPMRNLAITGIIMALWSSLALTVHLFRPSNISDTVYIEHPSEIIWYIGSGLEHFILTTALLFFLKTVVSVKHFTLRENVSSNVTDKNN